MKKLRGEMNWIRRRHHYLTITTMLIRNSNMFKECHHPVNHGPNVSIISMMAQGTIRRLQPHHCCPHQCCPRSSRYSIKSSMPWHNLIKMKMSWKLLILSLLRNKMMILRRRKQFWWKENVRMEKRMSGKEMKRWKLRMMETKKKLKKRVMMMMKKRGTMKKSWKKGWMKRVTRKKKWWKKRWKKKATMKSNNRNRRRLQVGKKVKISSNSRISKKWRLQNPMIMLISSHPH
mmetsp:Transcript_11358/g.19451  ORF Transcript_11358/g.19451 Transcript_11358/m.19451 type:complete len:232 (+) Transcript_11358:578-1273(+)